MRIGQLSQATGIGIETIRYYEKVGLLHDCRMVIAIMALGTWTDWHSFANAALWIYQSLI